jgi:hypothetical protein
MEKDLRRNAKYFAFETIECKRFVEDNNYVIGNCGAAL